MRIEEALKTESAVPYRCASCGTVTLVQKELATEEYLEAYCMECEFDVLIRIKSD